MKPAKNIGLGIVVVGLACLALEYGSFLCGLGAFIALLGMDSN